MALLIAGVLGPSIRFSHMFEGEEGDIFEATDPGAEECSDNELDALPIDPDTETEFAAGGDLDDVLADSDQDDPVVVNGHNNIFMGPV